jgi:hypothetical protein
MHKRLVKLFCCVAVAVLTGLILICPAVSASNVVKTPVSVGPVQQVNPYYSTQITTYSDGTAIERSIINGPSKPPTGYERERASVSLPKPNPAMGTNTITVPTYNWVFGCSSVSGAMILGYYDRNGYPNMYVGPANSGLAPLNNSITYWPTWTDVTSTSYPNLPLAGSHNGVDGRVTRGSIDDYWIQYNSAANDPYITGSWTQHTWSDGQAIGDYMKTSQSVYLNTDGSTNFWNYVSSSALLTCADMETGAGSPGHTLSWNDGTYGRKLFYEARGYTVTTCYNQKTDNTIAGGFSFAQYKAEIDAGRPVMLNLTGHTVVGVGYNDTGNMIYLHDTWHQDGSTQAMPWTGELQAGMGLLSVSIVNLAASSNPVPAITTLNPTSATAGGAWFTLTVNGSNFVSNSVVRWGRADLPTTFISATQLTAIVSASDIATGRYVTVTVFNPTPGGGTSGDSTFTVNNPMPVISSLSPGSVAPASGAFTLTVNGTNFVSTSVVNWDGDARATTFVSATQLTAAITATDVLTLATINITVFNPTPGGGTSSAVTFSVAVPVPGGGGGCFIATAAFGTPLEKHVQILRDFRDRFLLTTSAGQAFVKFYYEVSPPIAGKIAQSEGLRFITRGSLMPFVGMAYLVVTYGVTATLLLALSLMLMLGAVVWIIRRKMMMVNP